MRVGVTFADNRQRHADEGLSVGLAVAAAVRVVDVIAELGRGPAVRPGRPWRSRLSVGVKISYPVTSAAATSLR